MSQHEMVACRGLPFAGRRRRVLAL